MVAVLMQHKETNHEQVGDATVCKTTCKHRRKATQRQHIAALSLQTAINKKQFAATVVCNEWHNVSGSKGLPAQTRACI